MQIYFVLFLHKNNCKTSNFKSNLVDKVLLRVGNRKKSTLKLHPGGSNTRPDLHVVQSVQSDIVIVQLGTNNLSFRPPFNTSGFDLEDFVHLLHDSYGVQFVSVCHTMQSHCIC